MIGVRLWRAVFLLVGVGLCFGLALPEFVRAAWLCGPGGPDPMLGYQCRGPGLPAWSNLTAWMVGAPLLMLFISSRVREAVSIGAPFREPRSSAWLGSLALAFLAYMVALSSWPDWSMERARVDLASLVVWLTLAIYITAIVGLRTEGDLNERPSGREFPRWGWPILISGLLLYAGIFLAETMRMLAGTNSCPPDSVCDMPAMVFMAAMSVVWLPGWLLFIPFLASVADKRGVKPWYSPEARAGVILVALMVMAWGLLAWRREGSLLAGLYYLVFGGWFLLVQHLCAKAGKTSTLEISPPQA